MAFGHQKVESRRLLLREISQRGPVPRIDLAEHTGISRATVTSVTADLLRGGLIEEVPRESRSDEAARGRPRVDLKVAGGAHLIAGLKVSNTSISLVLMDFDGADVADHEASLPAGRLPASDLAAHIRDGLTELAAKAGRTLSDISGVGVGLAGAKTLSIVVAGNPNPLSASFKVLPGAGAEISTRIKMGESSDVIAAVETADAVLITRKNVKVTIGGCGG